MEILLIAVWGTILLVLGVLFYRLNRLGQSSSLDKAVELLQQQLEGLRGAVTKLYADNQAILQKVNTDLTQTLQNVDRNVNVRLDNAAKVIGDVHRS